MKCREFRKQYNLTLAELSAETGYSLSAISKWEREQDTMPSDFVDEVYRVYGVVIERQIKNFVFNIKHQEEVNELLNEIALLQDELDKKSVENLELKKKLSEISKICGGEL